MADGWRPRRLWGALASWLAGLLGRSGPAAPASAGSDMHPAGPAVRSWTCSYDGLGHLAVHGDAVGSVTTVTYDAAGVRVDDTQPAADVSPLTDAGWDACADAAALLESLRGQASGRKLVLYACAALRLASEAQRLHRASNATLMMRFAELGEHWADAPANTDGGALPPLLADPLGAALVVASRRRQPGLADLVRELFGNPFRPAPARTFPPHVAALARACYDGLPESGAEFLVMADALQELGEDDAAAHCREPEHFKGCHVLDRILGRD